jgi:hypothetical protein
MILGIDKMKNFIRWTIAGIIIIFVNLSYILSYKISGRELNYVVELLFIGCYFLLIMGVLVINYEKRDTVRK